MLVRARALTTKFRTLKYMFCNLSSLLSPHTYSIISSSPSKYQQCKDQMREIVALPLEQQAVRKRLNIAFSVSSLPEVFDRVRNDLYLLVKNGQIKSQSDLDRLVKWLNTQLRNNESICRSEIFIRLRTGNIQHLQKRLGEFLQENGKQVDVSSLTKQMRQEFPALQSKDIYQQVLKRFANKQPKHTRQIWDKLDQLKPRLLPYETNAALMIAEHKAITKGKLRFRFPPEPNGYLHIGHAKAIRINFESAKQKSGVCFLRFDDTNPDKESSVYIQEIVNQVRWLGYEPYKITFASDYFQQLLHYAHQLIKDGNAYVCSTPRKQIHEQRKSKTANPFRYKDLEYSLRRFPNLQDDEVLRLKLDPRASNPTMRDPIIYRRKDSVHPRTGSRYKIYPTYDYAHSICDSIQHIDYSLCSLEFEVRRELYYTILNLLGLYKPTVWEYSRLNIEGCLLSKRKIAALVQNQQVDGWADPRLMTLAGLRNRGYSPSMIQGFIDKVNASRAGNQTVVQANILSLQMKKELFQTSQRTMVVLKPILLHINNVQDRDVQVPLFPSDLTRGYRKVKLSKNIFIESSQRLTAGSVFGLKYVGLVKIVQGLNRLQAELQPGNIGDVKTKYIHWVPEDSNVTQVWEYFPLIKKDQVQQEVFNSENQKVYNARVPKDLDATKCYQFQRIGYFKWFNNKLICSCRL